MKRYGLFAIIGVILLAAVASMLMLRRVKASSKSFTIPLNASAEVPATTGADGAAKGTATISITESSDYYGGSSASASISFNVSGFSSADAITAAHIHEGGPTQNGAIMLDTGISPSSTIPLTNGSASFNVVALSMSTSLADQVMSNPAGFYFNIHTNMNPGGAIRGQMDGSSTAPGGTVSNVVLSTQLSPGNEVPAVTNDDSAASGSVDVTFSLTKDSAGTVTAASAQFKVTIHNLPMSDTIMAAHIHQGAAGVSGAVVINTGLSSPVTPSGATTTLNLTASSVSPSLAQSIIADPSNFYFNVHTNLNPGGAVRGQLGTAATPLPSLLVFTAQLLPTNEVTPVTNKDNAGVGEAIVTLHTTQDSSGTITAATADFAVIGLSLAASQSIILSHIHQGVAGVTGAVVVDSGLSPGSPVALTAGSAIFYREHLAVPPAVAQGLVTNASGFYFNVHTETNPGGAIRGQLSAVSLTASPLVFSTGGLMSGANEVPPVTGPDATAFGVAIVAIIPTLDSGGNITGGTAQFDVIAAGFPATDQIQFSHVHSGKAHKSGNVVIDSGISPSTQVAVGSQGSVAYSRNGLAVPGAVLQGMLAAPSKFYFNVHTNLNPGGAIRDQLAQAPVILSASVSGKKLVIKGTGFDKGAQVLINGTAVATKNDPASPTTSLIAKKGGSSITVGSTVILVVQDHDMVPSPTFTFTRSQ
jgi:hypothetical protein